MGGGGGRGPRGARIGVGCFPLRRSTSGENNSHGFICITVRKEGCGRDADAQRVGPLVGIIPEIGQLTTSRLVPAGGPPRGGTACVRTPFPALLWLTPN